VFPTDPALIDSRPQRGSAVFAAAPAPLPPPSPESEPEDKIKPLVPPAVADNAGPEEMVEVVLDVERVDPWLLIGQPIHVFWPDDDVFYEGVIESYKDKTHKHEVRADCVCCNRSHACRIMALVQQNPTCLCLRAHERAKTHWTSWLSTTFSPTPHCQSDVSRAHG